MPTPKVVRHMVIPGYEQSRGLPIHGETIQEFLDRMEWDFKIPTICVMNGEPVLRSEWAVTSASFDEITFLSRPYGKGSAGGGSKAAQVVGIVAVIALAAAAPWLAGVLAPTLGITAAAGISALTAGLALGGGMLISTLVQMTAGGQNNKTLPDADQIYSLQSSSNSAKPLGVIPVNYGRQKIIPDYGSQPWSEYISNDQYLNIQLTLGVGKHYVEQILLSDTILWDVDTGISDQFSASDISLQFCPPGTPITLFPTNIESSLEVTGQELPGPNPPGTYIGGFIANDSGTVAYMIVLDFLFPAGLWFVNRDGEYSSSSVTLQFYYRTVDSSGTPTSGWTQGWNEIVTNMTKTPIRMSFPLVLPPGRYEIRGNRSDLPNGSVLTNAHVGTNSSGALSYTLQQPTDTQRQDQVNWVGMRSYIQGSATFEHEYNIAIRMKADAQLSGQSANQFGVICERILSVWNGSAFVDQATSNPIWAFWDAATNTVYGAKRPISKVDFQAIVNAAAAANTRGDSFNYAFKDFVVVPEAFDTILASTRSKHCWIGDILSLVRDEWHDIPTMLLTDHQIVRGSLEVVSIFNDETGVDCIIGEFLNENTWRPAEIQFPPNTMSFTAARPSRIRIAGITNPDQMLQEVGFMWSQSQLRRTKVNLSTGHEGRMLKMMSHISVQSHLPRTWGQAGEVVSLAVDGITITTNRDLTFGSDTNYVEFRDKRARYFGPIICTFVGGHTDRLRLDAADLAIVESNQGMTLEQALDRMDGAEPPTFVLGVASELSRNCMLLSAKPNGDTVDLNLVVDDIEVHNGEFGGTGTFPDPPFVLDPKIPVASMLVALFRVGTAEPTLDVTWWPAQGAAGYRAQVSYDGGASWQGVYEGQSPGFSAAVQPAELIVRVQAFNAVKGPWVQVTVASPTIVLAPGTVPPSSMIAGLQDYVMKLLNQSADAVRTLQQTVSSMTAELDASNYLEHQELRRNLSVQVGNVSASFEEVLTVAISPGGVIAEAIDVVQVQVDDLSASVTVNSTTIGTIQGRMAATWGVTLDVNNYITGMQFLNDGTTSAFIINTDNFVIAKPGVLSPTTVFSIQTVAGVSTMALKGDFFADGAIVSRTIAALAITATHMSTDSITAANGAIASLAVKSLNIGDNAVTITQAQTLTSSQTPTPLGTYVTVSSLSVVVDTTGLAGKTVSIVIGFNAAVTFTGSYDAAWRLTAGGSTLTGIVTGASTAPSINTSAVYNFTASGGSQTIAVNFDYSTSAGGAGFAGTMIDRTLWAVTAKR